MSSVRCLWLLPALLGSACGWLEPVEPTPLGARTPVILLHGWSADASTWDEFVAVAARQAPAARRCKLYRFGYDWSQPITVSAARLAADLAGRPELLGRPVALVGHSMGGLVARTFAEARPAGEERLAAVGAVITLGTPHHGSPAANLHWLAGESRYSLLAGLIPLGLVDLLDRIPATRASRTEGGRDLGWDNYDGTMAPELWRAASRFLATLNAELLDRPDLDEVLARYSFNAGYLLSVGKLSALRLQQQLREGDHFGAGAALLAHGFRAENGREIDRWGLNDGIVPVESALFLKPGPPSHEMDGEAVKVRLDRITARLLRPGVMGLLAPGLNHSQLPRDPRTITAVLQRLADLEFEALSVTTGGGVVVCRPHQAGAVRVAAGRVLAAPDSATLIVRSGDALSVVGPTSARVVARAAGGEWVMSPDGTRAVAPDGALIGVGTPAYRRLAAAAGQALWSPDGQHLAYVDDAGRLSVVAVGDLTGQPAHLGDAPREAGLRPVAWTPAGQWLLASRAAKLTAVYRPDAGAAALLYDPVAGAVGEVCDPSGAKRGEWSIPPDPTAAGNRLAVMISGEATVTVLSDHAATPCWSADGRCLAWLDDGGLGTRMSGQTAILPIRGRLTALSATPLGFLAAGATEAGQGFAVAWSPGERAARRLADLPAAPAGAITSSGFGRYVALPLTGEQVWVAEVDGSWSAVVPGAEPVWIPAPAARLWTEPPTVRP